MQDDPIQPATKSEPDRLLRVSEVQARTGLKKSHLYASIKNGTFPAGVKLSSVPNAHAVAWVESSVDAWIAERIRQARGVQP